MKLYDMFSCCQTTIKRSSYTHGAKAVQELFPNVNPKNLWGGVVYADGTNNFILFVIICYFYTGISAFINQILFYRANG